MDTDELKTRLEITTRLGAILFVIVYVAGFLVVTFEDASFGIVAFGLFRAKVLSAGILLTVFLVLPVLETSRSFGLFGFPARLRKPGLVKGKAEEIPSSFWQVATMLSFFTSAWMTTTLMRWFMFMDYDFQWRYSAVVFGFLAVATALLVIPAWSFPKHPTIYALLSVATIGAGLTGLILLKRWQSIFLILWFLFVGFLVHRTEPILRKPEILRDEVSWYMVLVQLIGVVGFFTIAFYPRIPPMLGGGKPTRATFQFANSSPIDSTAKTEVWLVEEVDNGYYVLRSPNDHKAVFIAKPLVSAIYFEADQRERF